jgi:hypothetical protein
MILVGRHGEIKVNDDTCTAVITNPILEKKYGSIKVFPTSELSKWIKRLKIESTDNGQIKFGSWDE